MSFQVIDQFVSICLALGHGEPRRFDDFGVYIETLCCVDELTADVQKLLLVLWFHKVHLIVREPILEQF